MKTLGIIGVVLGVIAAFLGLYLQFFVVPAAEIADSAIEMMIQNGNENYYLTPEYRLNQTISHAVIDVGEIVMAAGLLAFLVGIVPAIKKHKIAWIGVVLGLLVFFIGAAYGTHMFS